MSRDNAIEKWNRKEKETARKRGNLRALEIPSNIRVAVALIYSVFIAV